MAKKFTAMLHICVIMLITYYAEGVPPPSVQLTSTLFEGDVAYDGQRVSFTCIATSTDDILTWSSDHYIGDILQIGFHDGPGFTDSNQQTPSTVATLINTTSNGGVMVIESRLQIIASMQNPISSVSCRINSHGPMNTITFRMSPLPSVQLTSTLFNGNLALEQQQVNFTCVVASTDDILTWSSDHYIGSILQIGFHDGPGFTDSNQQNPSTVATLINTASSGGVMVIESRLQIIASMQNPKSNVSCHVNSHGPMNTTTFQTVSELIELSAVASVTTKTESSDESTTTTPGGEGAEHHEDGIDLKIPLGIAIPFGVVVVSGGGGVLVAILGYFLAKKNCDDSGKIKKPPSNFVVPVPAPPSSSESSQGNSVTNEVAPLNANG